MCSPDYDHAAAANDWVDWLLQADLIDLADSHWNWMNWRLWLGDNDIEQPLGNRALQINSYPLVIEAACRGEGVALGWAYLVDDLIAQGRLLRPLDRSLKTEFGYYLIRRENQPQDDAVTRFCSWLTQHFEPGA